MRTVREVILDTMRHSNGTNWTPLAVSERSDYPREYVKNEMYLMCENGTLERVSRGLYRVPE